jgi:anti-sigma28 factor (negative regulator of flagellin synthesis)
VTLEDVVKLVVKSIARAATVEALETDIESGGIVLDGGRVSKGLGCGGR